MIIVTGASGLLGRQVLKAIQKTDDAIGTAYSRCIHPLMKLNLLDNNQVEEFMKLYKPQIVVHCAAERRPDVAALNEDDALKVCCLLILS
jgi:S-adenosylmethionine synthetase